MNQAHITDMARQIAVLGGAIFQVSASYGAGSAVGEIAQETRSLILPASYAFAIWGPIFILCGVYAVVQAFPTQREHAVMRAIGWWSAAAFLANGVWIYLYTNRQFVLAQIVILAALLCATVAYLRFTRAVPAARATTMGQGLIGTALGMLAGWLTAASVVGLAGTLGTQGLAATGGGAEVWGAVLLLAGAIMAMVLILASTRGPGSAWLAYGVAVLWALAAVVVEQRSALTITTASAVVGAIGVLGAMVHAWRMAYGSLGRSASA